MRYPRRYEMSIACLLALLFLPLTGWAVGGLTDFFTPPDTDISIQVMQNIFGTGSNDYSGKLLRPLLLVFSSGIVVFMGTIFAWNLAKFVLHTAQEGEMMIGKGKLMGLVVLRSVFGISMVLPIYGGTAFKGLSLSFIFVAWLITQGVGLADRGVNAIVDYFEAGGTIHQTPVTANEVTNRQDVVRPALDLLAAQVCMYQLRQIGKDIQKERDAIPPNPDTSGQSPTAPEARFDPKSVGGFFDKDAGQMRFGTRVQGSVDNYQGECGTVTWGIEKDNPQRNNILNLAMWQMMMDLDPLAARLARDYPAKCSEGSLCNASIDINMDSEVLAGIANSIINYINLTTPLRTDMVRSASQQTYNALQTIRVRGWITLGAFYPLMGNANQEIAQLRLRAPASAAGRLGSGQFTSPGPSDYDFTKLTADDKARIREQFNYITTKEAIGKDFIAAALGSGNTLQEQLKNEAANLTAGPFTAGAESRGTQTIVGIPDYLQQMARKYFTTRVSNARSAARGVEDIANNFDYKSPGSYTSIAFRSVGAGAAYGAYGLSWGNAWLADKTGINVGSTVGGGISTGYNAVKNFFGLGGENTKGGEQLGGLLEHGKLTRSAALVSLASIPGGPAAWASIPAMMGVFVDIVDRFRNTLDQTQSADPLMALQDFGFFVMDRAVALLGIILGLTFVASFALSWAFSLNLVGSLGPTANILSPILAIFFSALGMAGFGFGIYIPMIPLIVWISAILGWIGHSFQAIIGAPLVALRMTTAEGEGLLGGAAEGTMMLLGVLLTPFLLVIGFCAALILIKQVLIVMNYLFSIFAFYSLNPRSNSMAWIIIGVPAILLVYFTLVVSVVQALSTKLIGEFPGEVMRHLHTAMVGHKAAEQMMGKMEQAGDKGAAHLGEVGGKGSGGGIQSGEQGAAKKNEDAAKAKADKNKKS